MVLEYRKTASTDTGLKESRGAYETRYGTRECARNTSIRWRRSTVLMTNSEFFATKYGLSCEQVVLATFVRDRKFDGTLGLHVTPVLIQIICRSWAPIIWRCSR